MNVFGVLTSDRRRRGVRAMLGIFIVATLLFAALRFRETFYMQRDIATLKAQVAGHEQAHSELVKSSDERMKFIEEYLFGTVATQLDSSTSVGSASPAQWQRNRDAELRRRISELEKWRLSQR